MGPAGCITPAALGVPAASERGAESEVAHLWARWLLIPCRLGGALRFRAGGQNQKWPTCGQGGYLTPAASGVPSASERGAESEVAHLWARWLLNPCRLMGSPLLESGGQNQKWLTCGQRGYFTPAASWGPLRLRAGAESEVAHLWARWLLNPCRLGDPLRFRAGGRIRSGPLVGKVAT